VQNQTAILAVEFALSALGRRVWNGDGVVGLAIRPTMRTAMARDMAQSRRDARIVNR
jgi:hypothetical protein